MSQPTEPSITHRDVWLLAAPLILSNLSIPLLGAVDTAVVGRLADASHLGGVAIGGLLFSYLYWGFSFLRMGTTGLTAQAFGANDADEVRASLGRAMLVAVVGGIGLWALQGVAMSVAFPILDASAEVEAHAREYVRYRIWGAPAALANFAVLGWLFGVRRTREVLIIQLAQNFTNIALDIWFVVGLGWGVGGVGAATAISQYVGGVMGLVFVARIVRTLDGRWELSRLFDTTALKTLFRVNRDIFLRTLALITSFAYFTNRSAQFGDETLAANAILQTFQGFQAFGLDGLAHAAEILVGNALGARNVAAYRRAVRVTTIWAGGVAVAYALIFWICGGWMIDLMSTLEDVRRISKQYLAWAIISPLVSVWSFQLDGIFIGATRGDAMRNGMWVALIAFVGLSLSLTGPLGNHGLWLAFLLFMAVRAAMLVAYYPSIARSAMNDAQGMSHRCES
ncbi:MAG: MATE family efflux transporter [Candidatus Poribacteria bacterium]|nr:MATE family efflux transporter [Candidatus Poribacteria bacterium]